MEIIHILSHIFLIFIIFSIGYPILNNNYNYSLNNSDFCNQIIFNIVLHLNIILFLTFFGISLNLIIKIFIFYLLSIFVLMAYKDIFWFKKNKYYFFSIIIIFFVLSIDVSHELKQDWDSQIVWFYKTLNFYNDGTIKDLVNLPLGDGYSYPYLGSLVWAFFWDISFINEEHSGRIIYIFLYIVALYALSEKLKTNFINKVIFLLFLILLSYEYIYFSGSQDILIFCFISFLAFYIHEIFLKKSKKLKKTELILLPLIFNCLIWTKNEGLIYSFILLFILTFFSRLKLSQKMILIFSTIFLLSLKILVYKFYGLDLVINSTVYENISLISIFSNIFSYKTFIFLKYFFLFGFLKNFLFILGVISFIIHFQLKGFDKKMLYIYLFYIISFGFLLVAHTSIVDSLDLDYMLKVNMKRLVFAISPFFILLIIENLNLIKKKL